MSETTSSRRRARAAETPGHHRRWTSSDEVARFLARELHDSVAQTLSEMLLELEHFRVDQHGRASALQQIAFLEASTRKALADLRALLVELRAAHPPDQDLVSLIRQAMLERKRVRRSVEFGLQVAADWPERVPSAAATELLRIVTEAVDNALRHAGAKHVDVALGLAAGGEAVITITDDGRGMAGAGKPRRSGFGILGMRERAQLLSGTVSLSAAPSGRGTMVQVTLPARALHEID